MKIIGNIIWLLCGGLQSAIGYFTGSLALALTSIGIPVALQTFKIGLPERVYTETLSASGLDGLPSILDTLRAKLRGGQDDEYYDDEYYGDDGYAKGRCLVAED